ncbi:MAG: hypothetical protein ABFD25_03230 [Clostridiaceae bacterium]
MDWIVCLLIVSSMALVFADVERSKRNREQEYQKESDDFHQQLEAKVKRITDENNQRQEEWRKRINEQREKIDEELRKCGRSYANKGTD